MRTLRNVAAVVLVLFTVSGLGACADDEAAAPEEARSDLDAKVAASEETKAELGIVEWRIAQGEEDGRFVVHGLDAQGAAVAGVWLRYTELRPGAGSFDYEVVEAPDAAPISLYFQFNGDATRTNADELSSERARSILTHLGADTQAVDPEAPAQSTLVTRSLTPRGGHVGGPLVRQTPPLTKEPKCLIDNSGNKCYGALIQVTAGIVGTGVCVLTAPATFGLHMAGCVAAGAATAGSIVSMKEAGCKARPCPK